MDLAAGFEGSDEKFPHLALGRRGKGDVGRTGGDAGDFLGDPKVGGGVSPEDDVVVGPNPMV